MSKKKPTVADAEAKAGVPNGTLRNPNGSNARQDQHVATLEKRHGKAAVAAQLGQTPEAGKQTPGAAPGNGLYQRIQQVLNVEHIPLWRSESDFPITAYQAHVSQLQGWEDLNHETAYDLLSDQDYAGSHLDPMGGLLFLLRNHPVVAYKRPTPGEASCFDLVIGVVEGKVLTGIQTRVIET